MKLAKPQETKSTKERERAAATSPMKDKP